MFGSPKVTPEERERTLRYLANLMSLTKRQDEAAQVYNDALIRSGGTLGPEVVAASEVLLQVARILETEHSGAEVLPVVALETFAKWQQTWLEYRMWCEAQASVLAAGPAATQEAMRRNRLALEQAERSRQSAEKVELKLMKSVKMNGAEVQALMQSLYR